MKRFFAGMFSLLLGSYVAGCGTVRDHDKEEVTVSVPHVICFGNLTEVIIDPEKRNAALSTNISTGNAVMRSMSPTA